MADSDMDISGESDNELSKFASSASQNRISMIPMPPMSTSATENSQKADGGKRYMSLKKRWLQNIEKEPKKRKVSLEAYRKRHVSESGESGRSPSDIDNASSDFKAEVKLEYRLAREERERQSGKKLQKMTIGDLEKRKIKLKEALRKIEASSAFSERKQCPGNQEAKSEFDKFMEKQSRWLAKRAKEKQREVKMDKFNSSMDKLSPRSQSPMKRHISASRTRKEHHRHTPNVVHTKKQKQVAVVRPRGQSELTSTLQCLQKAKEEVQRQLSLLKSPSDSPCRDLSVTTLSSDS